MGPPTSSRDGSSTSPRLHSGASILQEAAPASDGADQPFIPYQSIPATTLCAAEGSHLGGSLPDLGGGYWFSPSELVMTSLMHFEEKVHRKGLTRAESLPLLMPRLLCQVLEHMGFPAKPRIERRVRCPLVLSVERVMTMPVSFHLRQQDQEEVPDQVAEDSHRDDVSAPEPEIQRSPAPQMSPPSPPPHSTSAAAADTPGPSYSAYHSSEHVHASSREIAGVMDAFCSLAATQAAQDQRLA